MLYKCRTKRQAFPLRTFIICPLGFCAATGFLFGACDTGELEEKKKKKRWKNTAIYFLIMAWWLFFTPALRLLV